jgi:hypothetical protein
VSVCFVEVHVENILLVQPAFPIPCKSRNHRSYFPVGLLKLATYYRHNGCKVELALGNRSLRRRPDQILITSLFTYWSSYVHDAVRFYKTQFSKAKVTVGGIYATLMPDHCATSGCDEVFVGLHEEAEKCLPDLRLIRTDYQVLHASRGCPRKCRFCGVRLLEKDFVPKRSVLSEVKRRRLVFYDNNFLANPYAENILLELATIRLGGKPVVCESQSGFDARLLTPDVARMLKQAHFIYPRVAWDGGMAEEETTDRAIRSLVNVGYRARDISVYMLYNHHHPLKVLSEKLRCCGRWGVQISDCRYRPLNAVYDGYQPSAGKNGQSGEEYYIHPNWTDGEIREFRRLVRRQNICVRYGFGRYSLEKENAGKRFRMAGRQQLA